MPSFLAFQTLMSYMILSVMITVRVSKHGSPYAFSLGGLFLSLLGLLVLPTLANGLEHSTFSPGTQSIIIDFFLIFSYTLGGRALWEGLLKLGQVQNAQMSTSLGLSELQRKHVRALHCLEPITDFRVPKLAALEVKVAENSTEILEPNTREPSERVVVLVNLKTKPAFVNTVSQAIATGTD